MKSHSFYHEFVLSKNSVQLVPAIIISICIIIVTWYCNRIIQKLVVKVSKDYQLEDVLIQAIQNLTYWFVYAIGATLFLENLHIQMSAVFGTLGVIAVGVGFALQKALANMTSGMMLLFYKPFFIGDYISSKKPKFEGKIIEINLRSTTLEYQGNITIIPNHTLYGSVVTVKKTEK